MIKINSEVFNVERFPNGELKLPILNSKNISRDKELTNRITLKYESETDLIVLMMLKAQLDFLYPDSTFSLIIAYMPYERMDRVHSKEEFFTLKMISNFINNMHFNEVVIAEPHSDVCVALLNNARGVNTTYNLAHRVLTNELKLKKNDVVICYPDAGAQKRYSQFEEIGYNNTIVGFKKRDWETGRILKLDILGSDVKGKTVIIVDDLSSFGGTFMLTAEELKKKGAKEVILVVTHAETNILKGNIFKSDLIDKVYCTDSIIDINDETNKIEKLKIYPFREVM